MTIDDMKEVHLKLHDGIWMNRKLELIDDVFGETFRFNMGRGEPLNKEEMTEMLNRSWQKMDSENHKIVRTDYHGKAAEGDLLAVWQTNFFSDDSSSEEINLFKFENGKVATFKSFKSQS